jgi:hypothetical protein
MRRLLAPLLLPVAIACSTSRDPGAIGYVETNSAGVDAATNAAGAAVAGVALLGQGIGSLIDGINRRDPIGTRSYLNRTSPNGGAAESLRLPDSTAPETVRRRPNESVESYWGRVKRKKGS